MGRARVCGQLVEAGGRRPAQRIGPWLAPVRRIDRVPALSVFAGFTVTRTAAGLFRLLCVAILARDSAPSGPAVTAAQALFDRDGSAPRKWPRLARASWPR